MARRHVGLSGRGAAGPTRVLCLIAVLVGSGVALDVMVLHLHPRASELFSPTALAFLAAFAVTEALVLHLEVGRNAHSVTLSELTLVIALFFLPAAAVMPVRVVAGAAVLYAIRHQRALKLGFNTAVWILDVPVAILVFRALGGSAHDGLSGLLLPAFGAGLAAALVDSLAVNAVIALSSGSLSRRRLFSFLQACLLGAVMSSTMAVVSVTALARSPWLALPIVCLLAMVVLAFHRFGVLRQQHTNIKVLYAFTDELARSAGSEQVVTTVLRRVGGLLRAEHVRLLVEADGGRALEMIHLGDAGLVSDLQPITGADPRLLSALVTGTGAVIPAGTRDESQRAMLDRYGVRDAVLAPMASEQGLRGLLTVAGRSGEYSTFSADDLLLLQTLAAHAAAALANSRLVERLNHESLHDSLTGLANRALFQQELTAALDHPGARHAVLLMDLDRFKEVNDTLGHHHGDLLLCEVANRLRSRIGPNDTLARLGGDEFAVLMTDVDAYEASAVAECVLEALTEPMRLQGVTMEVTGSCGLVLAPDHGRDADLLLQRADVAMYLAKHDMAGVRLYQAQQDDYSPRRLALAGNLRTALEAGQLTLRYQPQARIDDASIIGAEALVRWQHPDYGDVMPDDFVSIAEQTGQIRELTRYVLDAAVHDCAGWAAAGHPMAVSVNISVRNLLENDLAVTVAETLSRHGLPSSRLTLEITETHLMADPARTGEVLRALDRLGVRLSVDDFGTGYSSLAYLKQLPVREVKVDRSFVRDLGSNSDDAAIVEAIIQLAHTLGVEVVAEGVEDAAAQDRLLELECDLVQGYHLARPMTDVQLHAWLDDRPAAVRRNLLGGLPIPRVPDSGTALAL
jgi:diguanylate cyclase (GGDEF)-like protein